MKQANPRWPGSVRARVLLWCIAGILCGLGFRAMADVVEMQNGDRYVGTVVSMGSDKLILQGQVLGRLELPRNQVAIIGLGANAVSNIARVQGAPKLPPQPSLAASTNAGTDVSRMLRQLAMSTNMIQQVQQQFLSDAGPEAKDKFNELLSGLSTGKLNLNDLRAQAKSAADQVRALKKELGGDAGESMDLYLNILDRFIKEAGPDGGASTSPAPTPPATKPEADE